MPRPKTADQDEMCIPGGTGMTWHEPTFVPMLADFECVRCGSIGCACDHDAPPDEVSLA